MIVLAMILPVVVTGKYVPPVYVYLHFVQDHIPVPSLQTDMRPHLGHLKACLMFSSMSATSTLVLRP